MPDQSGRYTLRFDVIPAERSVQVDADADIGDIVYKIKLIDIPGTELVRA